MEWVTDLINEAVLKAFDTNAKIEIEFCEKCGEKKTWCNAASCKSKEFNEDFNA